VSRFWGKGSVYPRGERWWAKYRDPTTHEVERIPLGASVRTREQAERVLARILARRSSERGREATISLAEALESFLAEKSPPVVAKWTHATYQKHLTHFLNVKNGLPTASPLGLVTSDDIRRYRDARKKVVKPQTVNKELTTLSTFFGWAMKEEPPLTERNPTVAVGRLEYREEEQRPCPPQLFGEVLAAVRADAEARPAEQAWRPTLWADIAEAAYWTGWRAGELCVIQVAHVDMDAWTVELRSAWNKGGTTIVAIPPEIRGIVKRRMKAFEKRPEAHVFGDPDGAHAYWKLYAWWGKWVKKHPDHQPAHLHSLRHAFTTDVDRIDGASDALKQKLTRHRTVKMLRRYTHRDLDEQRVALSHLAKLRKRSRRRT
jgi:integrase